MPCGDKCLEAFPTPGQVIAAMRESKVSLLLDSVMVGHILDALEVRREAWEKTSAWFRGALNDPYFVIEECSDAEEADQIAAYYHEIECELRAQMDLHSRQPEDDKAEDGGDDGGD